MKVFLLVWLLVISVNVALWPILQRKPSALSLDPAPGPYTWSRVNPETNVTCLIVEAQYNAHPIAMWCERLTDADRRPVYPLDAR